MSISRDTYLTLDLDYWMTHHDGDIQEMFDFLRAIIRCRKEICVVKYHNEIINHIKKFTDVTRLINIDYHSDITDLSIESCGEREFSEGTWVNYVTGMQKKEFIWRFPFDNPRDLAAGYCHTMESPFKMSLADRKSVGWDKINMIQGLPNPTTLLRCAAFGICVSPNWAPRNHTVNVVSALATLGIIQKSDIRRLSTENKPSVIRALDRRIYRSIHE